MNSKHSTNLLQITVELNRQAAAESHYPPQPNPSCYRLTQNSVTSPFFLSPTGLRAHNMDCRNNDSLSPLHSKHSRQLPPLIKPRRRLLFLTPTRLLSNGNQSSDRNTLTRASYTNTKSSSQHDLRPRWIDLNKFYCEGFSSSETAIDALPFSMDNDFRQRAANNRSIRSESKVKTWLENRRDGDKTNKSPKTTLNIVTKEYETPL